MEFTLTAGQYDLVYNALPLSIATLFGSGIFLRAARSQKAPRYRPAPRFRRRAAWRPPIRGPAGSKRWRRRAQRRRASAGP
jgi:hypothetical protein